MEERTSALLEALDARRGILAAVGAGGKKTTLYQIFSAHPGRVALTTTTFITDFGPELGAEILVAPEDELEEKVRASRARKVAYATPSDKPGRVAAVSGERIARLHREGGFDLTLVKADGARSRLLKAPAPHEPSLPEATDTVLLILSLQALGRPLSETIAHRPERVSALTGRPLGEPVTIPDFVALYTHENGLLQGTSGKRAIPVLNMVDDDRLLPAARAIAEATLAACPRFERFVLTSLRRPGYLVEVVRR